MQNLLIITGESDIPIAEMIAKDLSSYTVYVFDPTLVDKINASTLINLEFIDWHPKLDSFAREKLAHSSRIEIELELQMNLRGLLKEYSILGWQHKNLFQFFAAYFWYSELWLTVLDKLAKGKPYIFLCDNPAYYYWPSFLPALLLLQQLKTKSIPFSALSYGVRPDESDVVINLCEPSTSLRYDILTHLPTCFYDINYFNAELLASGKTIVNIRPKYWDVEVVATKTVKLLRIKDQQLLNNGQPKLNEISECLAEQLDRLLIPYIATPSFRDRQVQQLQNLYLSQWISLNLLEQFFSEHKPGKIILSDTDAGFHGPLLAFAENHNISVLMLPHSKISMNTEFGYRGITMLTHPMQSQFMLDVNEKSVPRFSLNFPEDFSASSYQSLPIRKIALVLNGLSLNGVLSTTFALYLEGIKQIATWCEIHDIKLSIRSRPGETLSKQLAELLNLNSEELNEALACSLAEFAESQIDVCVMYDAPTTGVIEFLKRSIPVINAVPERLSVDESLISDALIPRDNIEKTLSKLELFSKDLVGFQRFKTRQFLSYLELFKEARAFSEFL